MNHGETSVWQAVRQSGQRRGPVIRKSRVRVPSLITSWICFNFFIIIIFFNEKNNNPNDFSNFLCSSLKISHYHQHHHHHHHHHHHCGLSLEHLFHSAGNNPADIRFYIGLNFAINYFISTKQISVRTIKKSDNSSGNVSCVCCQLPEHAFCVDFGYVPIN